MTVNLYFISILTMSSLLFVNYHVVAITWRLLRYLLNYGIQSTGYVTELCTPSQ